MNDVVKLQQQHSLAAILGYFNHTLNLNITLWRLFADKNNLLQR